MFWHTFLRGAAVIRRVGVPWPAAGLNRPATKQARPLSLRTTCCPDIHAPSHLPTSACSVCACVWCVLYVEISRMRMPTLNTSSAAPPPLRLRFALPSRAHSLAVAVTRTAVRQPHWHRTGCMPRIYSAFLSPDCAAAARCRLRTTNRPKAHESATTAPTGQPHAGHSAKRCSAGTISVVRRAS